MVGNGNTHAVSRAIAYMGYLRQAKDLMDMEIDPSKLGFDQPSSQMNRHSVLRGFIFPTDFNQNKCE